ncbi:hypothetical protein [Paenibacillus sp. GCM10027626]
MKLFKKLLNKEPNITKYRVGERVPPNKKADKIVKETIREIKDDKRRWL